MRVCLDLKQAVRWHSQQSTFKTENTQCPFFLMSPGELAFSVFHTWQRLQYPSYNQSHGLCADAADWPSFHFTREFCQLGRLGTTGLAEITMGRVNLNGTPPIVFQMGSSHGESPGVCLLLFPSNISLRPPSPFSEFSKTLNHCPQKSFYHSCYDL